MNRDDAIFDVVLMALADQFRHPDRHGGGLIGKAAAVVLALGLDGDAPVSTLGARLATAVPVDDLPVEPMSDAELGAFMRAMGRDPETGGRL